MKLKLDGWELGITFSACHFLPGHSKCNRLHGHNYGMHLHLKGEPLKDGIVHDFVALKRAMKEAIEELDHCVLLPGKSADVNIIREGGQVNAEYSGKHYSFPEEDVNILDLEVVSAEMLAYYVLERILDKLDLGENVTGIKIGIDEGAGQGAWAYRKL